MTATEGDWRERIKGIAGSLLTLEINIIEKESMSASKMPDMPLALHQIATLYAGWLAEMRCFVTDDLLTLVAAMLQDGEDVAKRDAVEAWKPANGDKQSLQFSNGPKTFEALRWVADAARKQLDSADSKHSDIRVLRTLTVRIAINCRQLRQVSLMLLEHHKGLPGTRAIAAALFDGTIEQTTGTMFKIPRPNLEIDTDILVLVRKVWDIGLEQVMFQTVMQIDGDVLVRMAPVVDPVKQDFYGQLHRSTVDTALKQWHGLFQLAANLLAGVGQTLFGPKV